MKSWQFYASLFDQEDSETQNARKQTPKKLLFLTTLLLITLVWALYGGQRPPVLHRGLVVGPTLHLKPNVSFF